MADTPKLIVLGSGSAVPSADRTTSCYLVVDKGTVLLIDLGPGALQRAAALGYALDSLDGVLITHIHPDHTADLVALQFALHNPSVRCGHDTLPVFGDASIELLAERLRNAYPGWLDPGPGRIVWEAVAVGDVALPGGIRGETFKIEHHPSSLGWRLTLSNGFVIAFSGDAVESDALVKLGAEANLFVLESAGPDQNPMKGHLTPRRAGDVAAQSKAGRLLLTHFYPETLNEDIKAHAREGFEGEVLVAEDAMSVELGV